MNMILFISGIYLMFHSFYIIGIILIFVSFTHNFNASEKKTNV